MYMISFRLNQVNHRKNVASDTSEVFLSISQKCLSDHFSHKNLWKWRNCESTECQLLIKLSEIHIRVTRKQALSIVIVSIPLTLLKMEAHFLTYYFSMILRPVIPTNSTNWRIWHDVLEVSLPEKATRREMWLLILGQTIQNSPFCYWAVHP